MHIAQKFNKEQYMYINDLRQASKYIQVYEVCFMCMSSIDSEITLKYKDTSNYFTWYSHNILLWSLLCVEFQPNKRFHHFSSPLYKLNRTAAVQAISEVN